MLYRKMEKTGDELSILGFGCMRLPETQIVTLGERHGFGGGLKGLLRSKHSGN